MRIKGDKGCVRHGEFERGCSVLSAIECNQKGEASLVVRVQKAREQSKKVAGEVVYVGGTRAEPKYDVDSRLVHYRLVQQQDNLPDST
jgi:hypothetical protein